MRSLECIPKHFKDLLYFYKMEKEQSVKSSKYSEKDVRIITANLFVARKMSTNPTKVVKFILNNRAYFPTITDSDINTVIKEKGLSWDIINSHPDVIFADIND